MDRLPLYLKIKNELDIVKLKKLEFCKLGTLMAFPLVAITFNKFPSIWRQLLSLAKLCIIESNQFRVVGNTDNSILVITTHTYLNRKDHINTMKAVAAAANPCTKLEPYLSSKLHLRLGCFFRIISWSKSLSNIQIGLQERFYILYNALIAYVYLENIKSIVDFSKYRSVVVRMDGQLLDNVIVQYAKSLGCKTVTIQDGYEVRCCKSADVHWQIQAKMRGSCSDYFITWSKYFADVVKTSVSDDCNIVVLGMPKFIYKEEQQKKIDKTRSFGVMLDYHSKTDSNAELVQIANEISKTFSIPYVLRYHPLDQIFVCDDLIDGFGRIEIEKGKNQRELSDFIRNKAFIIACNSSTIIESGFVNPYTYRMIPKRGVDILKECNYPLTFSTVNELTLLVKNSIELGKEYREYVCGPRNVTESYVNFFNSIR